MTETDPPRASEPLLFDAVLHPSRSLSRAGFVVLMAALKAALARCRCLPAPAG